MMYVCCMYVHVLVIHCGGVGIVVKIHYHSSTTVTKLKSPKGRFVHGHGLLVVCRTGPASIKSCCPYLFVSKISSCNLDKRGTS